ncbi:Hsp20/alpha crystallin family protein [Crenobacter sp. SG2305]|uniref:Hsp20/alpha crystallin family protein n=1 Tax=Crenobacter oryzisoli TaxID=3056844 RepID=UPI0025AA8FC2|nr:Hsp20/alpha crystallin family protein [Crenobacter sp. SG2305]MDN0081950.1 Hsp20/alpha crystallin family protein [Crenobacter sp. SG2305]
MADLTPSEEKGKITEYDPFKFYANMHKLFGNFFSQEPWQLPANLWSSSFSPMKFAVDLSESDTSYRIAADLPGVKKEDIKVDVDGNVVTIAAEITEEKKSKEGERVVHSERRHGEFFRRFSLDKSIDGDNVKATYNDGVLELILPKKESSQSKKIAIQ